MEIQGLLGDDCVRNRWSLSVLIVCLVIALATGCTGSKPEKQEGADQAAALKPPMLAAAEALERVAAQAKAGDLAGARLEYQRFTKAFGQVLGPVSLKDAHLAQRMANANSVVRRAMAAEKLDAELIAREAGTITAALQESAGLLGTAVTASAQGGSTAQPARAQTFEVRAREHRFTPARIEVEKGTRVTVRLVNEGTKKHEWELDAFGVEIRPIAPGATGEVTFIADREGTFVFVCKVDQHDKKGMRGVLVVK